MQPTDYKPPRGAGVHAGPDLLRRPAKDAGESRILARLEHGDGAFASSAGRQRRRSRTAAAAVLLVLVGALAWTLYQHATNRPPAAAVRVNLAAVVGQGPAQAQTKAAEPAAAIVNELAAAPASVARSGKRAATKSAAAARAGTEASPADGDVALLTALVAHANQETLPALPAPAPPVNRDVVQLRAGETTESLLRRCRQLGPVEGKLCHQRICSDRRNSEPACQ